MTKACFGLKLSKNLDDFPASPGKPVSNLPAAEATWQLAVAGFALIGASAQRGK
jgi:hypothetical protein